MFGQFGTFATKLDADGTPNASAAWRLGFGF